MKFSFCLSIVVCLLVFQCSISSNAQNSDSAKIYGILPEIHDVQISPDGSKILIIQNYQGRRIIVTKSLGSENVETYGLAAHETGEYSWARWTSNEDILVSIRLPSRRDGGRRYVDTTETRLITANWKGQNLKNPLPSKVFLSSTGFGRVEGHVPQFQDRVVDFLMHDPEHVLIQLDAEEALKPDVYLLNIKDGDLRRIQRQRARVQTWMTDHDHIVRYGAGKSLGGGIDSITGTAYYRKNEDDSFFKLYEYNLLEEDAPYEFEGFSPDPDVIYVSMLNHSNKKAYYEYNVDSKEVVGEIASSDEYDINSISINEQTGEIEAYSFNDHKNRIVRLSEQGKGLSSLFSTNFPDEMARIVSASDDNRVMIVNISSPKNPGTFYILDLNKGSMEPMAYNYYALDLDELSEMHPISYTSSDGLTINGYLSLPNGSNGTNLPMVILPHGGPWGVRDNWGFDYWVQFLNSLGYGVLQMNYRGSSGYGQDFVNKGYGEWGGKILDDVNAGTKWVIEQGIADAGNICIMGGSYGGYAALQSVVKEPDLYKCSIAFAPITDLTSFMSNERQYASYNLYRNFMKSDEWSYDEASPSKHIDKINIPVLLVHGDEDRSVRVRQSQIFYDAMRDANKNVDYIEFEKGDHYLSRQVHRVEFLERVEEFLARYLD